jgi:hypothetical protein
MPFATAQIVCRSILCGIVVTHGRPKTTARSAYSESPDDVGASGAGVANTCRNASRMEMKTLIQKVVRTDFNNTAVNSAYFVPESLGGPL